MELRVAEAQRLGDLIGVRTCLAEDDDEPDPWTLSPSRRRIEKRIEGRLPAEVTVVRANMLFVEKRELPPAMLNRLLRVAAFQNPEFYKAQSMRLSTYDKPRVIGCGEDLTNHLALPRGCISDLAAVLEEHGSALSIRDERTVGTAIDVEFRGKLRSHQTEAVEAVIAHDDRILCAPTAFGKTAAAAWIIAQRKVSTLILGHRQQLLDQWRERLAMFLDTSIDSIGQIGGGKFRRTGYIDVAVIQSLYQKHEVKDFIGDYGQIIADECQECERPAL